METKTLKFNERKYTALLVNTVPRVIKSEAEYDRVETIFERLIDKGSKRSPEEDSLFDLLANLLEDYERRVFEPIEAADPTALLASLIQANDLKQKDLADIFGGQSVVSDILNRKREINKDQAKKLGARFSISPAAFI